jgi:hypothetical protein
MPVDLNNPIIGSELYPPHFQLDGIFPNQIGVKFDFDGNVTPSWSVNGIKLEAPDKLTPWRVASLNSSSTGQPKALSDDVSVTADIYHQGKVAIGGSDSQANLPQVNLHVVRDTAGGTASAGVSLFETRNLDAAGTSQLPEIGLVRQFPTSLYAPATNGLGGRFGWYHRSAASGGLQGYLFIQGSTRDASSYFEVQTRIGLTNGNPVGGTQEAPFRVEGLQTILGTTAQNTPQAAHKLTVYGTAYKSTPGTAWVVPSDERLKNLGPRFNAGLKELCTLNPVSYSWKDEDELGGAFGLDPTDYGISATAQEIELCFPEAVTVAPFANISDCMAIDTTPLLWAAINALQEVERRLAALEQKESYFLQLETEIEQLRADAIARRPTLVGRK